MQKRNYAIGRNGALVKVESPLVEGWEECDSLKTLLSFVDFDLRDDIQVGVTWKGSKLPADVLKKILGTIRQFPNMETGYVLCYRVSDNSWKVICPEQRGYGASVHYEATDIEDGYGEVGTIHTHPNMGAFWSGTDRADMKDTPGVYVVFGLKEGKPEHTLCTICTANGEYDKDLWEIFEEVDLKGDWEPDETWVETIKKQSYVKKTTVPPFGALPHHIHKPGSSVDTPAYGGCYSDWWEDESDLSRRYKPAHNYGYNYRPSRPYTATVPRDDNEGDARSEFLSKMLDLILSEYELEDIVKALKDKGDELRMDTLLYTYDTVLMPKPADVASDLNEHMTAALIDMEPEEIQEMVKKFNDESLNIIEPEIGHLTLKFVPADDMTYDGLEEQEDGGNA